MQIKKKKHLQNVSLFVFFAEKHLTHIDSESHVVSQAVNSVSQMEDVLVWISAVYTGSPQILSLTHDWLKIHNCAPHKYEGSINLSYKLFTENFNRSK